MTVCEALTEAASTITRRDAELLLAFTLTQDRTWLLAHPDEPLNPTQLDPFHTLCHRRAAG